jgi:hypothetical protein
MGGVHVAQIAFGVKPGKEQYIERVLHDASLMSI